MTSRQQIKNLLRDTNPAEPESLMRFANQAPAIIEQLLREADTALNKGTDLAMSIADNVIEGICRYGDLRTAWREMPRDSQDVVKNQIVAIVLERMERVG